ncbi:MAG TPA: ABC transporter permease, partial [Puia sp.]|nr:ABC transporter permease [Puia sp.]
MFKNFFKTAWRNLLRNRTSSFINISGLSIGMAVAMLIACWIYQEWSFDRQFGNYKTIAQVWQRWSGGHGAQWQMPAAVADELRDNFGSNFKHVVLSSRTQDDILSFGDKKLIRSGNFIEPDGLKLFTVPMRYGNLTALNDPHSIILSASLSRAFFGDRNPVGQILRLNDSIPLKVTGVYEDFAYTSSLAEVQFLSPWALYASFDPQTAYNRHSWGDNNWQTFVQIADNTSFEQVSAKIEKIKAIHDPWPDSTGR